MLKPKSGEIPSLIDKKDMSESDEEEEQAMQMFLDKEPVTQSMVQAVVDAQQNDDINNVKQQMPRSS